MECTTIERYEDGQPIYKSKKKYDTLDEAIAHAKVVNSGDHIIHKVVAYKCKVCLKYHIGRNGNTLKDKDRTRYKSEINYRNY
jgi:hypothetical protein